MKTNHGKSNIMTSDCDVTTPQQEPGSLDCGAYMFLFIKLFALRKQPGESMMSKFTSECTSNSTRNLLLCDFLNGVIEYKK